LLPVRAKAIIAAVIVAGLAVGGLALASLGGEEDRPTQGTDLTALRCPLVPTAGSADGEQQYEPAPDAFDTAELIGLPLDDASAVAAEHGCEIVVSVEDGRGVPVPIDVDPKRIYVYTEGGSVTEIEGVGGGI
jgi:hypothetical protein